MTTAKMDTARRWTSTHFFAMVAIHSDSLYKVVGVTILVISLCCSVEVSSHNDPIQEKLLDMIESSSRLGFERKSRSDVDLREHRLFTSDPRFDCCPTITELTKRKIGVNPQGIILDLFYAHNFTQNFYERVCHPEIKDRRCQFIDPKYEQESLCVQQYTYVYAIARTYGQWKEPYRMDYVRIGTGCKCQINADVMYSDMGNTI